MRQRKEKRSSEFVLAVTNARSIENKIDSMYDMFNELDVSVAVITETWSKDNENYKRIKERSEHEHGLSIIAKHRPGRKKGGGVFIVAKNNCVEAKEYKLKNSRFEIVVTKCKIIGINRPLFIFGMYVSTALKKADVLSMFEMTNEEVLKIKTKEKDPMFVFAGDFNRNDVTPLIGDYEDIEEYKNSPGTRQGARLDLVLSNINKNITSCEITTPLDDSAGTLSDHSTLVVKFALESRHKFKIIKYKSRTITPEAINELDELLSQIDWNDRLAACVTPSCMVEALNNELERCMNKAMPLKTKTRKSTDDPWINDPIRKAVKKRMRIYRAEGRSVNWRHERDRCTAMIRKAKKNYYDRELLKAKTTSGSKLAYQAIRNLQCSDRPKQWSVNDLAPEIDENDLLEKLADYFSAITSSFEPVDIDQIPVTYDAGHMIITEEMVEERLRTMKKPKGTVPGDVPPKALATIYKKLVTPLHRIFNKVLTTYDWPSQWKTEFQTIIPKKNNPTTFDECRNIACTNHFSKILESFALDRLKGEIQLSDSQYGGVKGCSVENFLIDTWDSVFTSLENEATAVNILSIDFSKAFNRVKHGACLKKMAQLGASNESLKMVFAFLRGRKMFVRNGDKTSTERAVTGGTPQGTKLGNYLFCCAIDSIEKDESSREYASAIPDQYQPTNTSTPVRRKNSEDLNQIANPYGMRIKKNVWNDTIIQQHNENEDIATFTVVKYVDDVNVVEELSLAGAENLYTTRRQETTARGLGSEAVLGIIGENCEELGMLINTNKTQSLCISDCNYYDVQSEIRTTEGVIKSGTELKILGFVFGPRPDVSAHVNYTIKKFNRCSWSLTHLKRAGISERSLVDVYTCSLRAVIEFCSVVYHPLLTAEQSELLERLQKRVLKIVYGFDLTYEELLNRSGLTTLNERRKTAFEKFTVKMASNSKFSGRWFPRWENEFDLNLREEKKYIEFHARTQRLYNSQLYQMRRFLNSSPAI